MRQDIARALVVASAGLWLAGCSTSNKLSDMFGKNDAPAETAGASAMASADTTGSIPSSLGAPAAAEPGLLGGNAADDLAKGKQEYRNNNFGMAERYFRRAAETHPRDAEAWLGLAASYDRLRRFDLADRAYDQAIGLVGPTPEILNNQGYSFMLRGDFARARATLEKAQRKDPANKYVANNLRLLADSQRKGKAIE
ncbi:MAG TPA: tetratricopeptide repeat protein [Pseudolabrys sp.]|nr:tetratricopeptide repeat protein [Pseudolabrys sp.]